MPNLLLLGLAAVLVGCARAGPLPIDESRYSRNYVLQLRRGAVLFRAWQKQQEGSDGSDPYQWDGEPLDLALERVICKAKESGIPYYLAIHAVLFARSGYATSAQTATHRGLGPHYGVAVATTGTTPPALAAADLRGTLPRGA